MSDRLYVRMDMTLSYDLDLAADGVVPEAMNNLPKVRDMLKQELEDLISYELDGEVMDNVVLNITVYCDKEPYT